MNLARRLVPLLLSSTVALMLLPSRARNASAQPAPSPIEAEPDPASEAAEPIDAGPGVGPPTVTVTRLMLDAGAPVASGRGVMVSAAEVYDRISDATSVTQAAWAQSPRGVADLVDRLVADRLLVIEARRRGLDRDPAVRAAFERAMVARLRATVINPSAGDGAQVTPDEIRAFYDAHASRFHLPERRRASVIFLTERREAARVLRLALALRRRRPAHPFRELALRYNTDPSLVRLDGELREVTPQQTDIDPALRDAVFAIASPGDVATQLVRGHWNGVAGYFVIRLVARRPAYERTLADSADWIRQRIVLEHRVAAERAMIERLANEARVVRVPAERIVRITVQDAGVAP